MINTPSIKDKAGYVRRLAEYIADRRITIEVCLTSNLQTNPKIGDLSKHAFKAMREARLSTTLCTDNRLVSNTTVTKELLTAVEKLRMTPREFRNVVVAGFKSSFFPGTYNEKRHYVRLALDRYEQLEREWLR
jgi:adenosine deaminase